MFRKRGTVEELCDVAGVQPVADWISAIPFEEWPQQFLEGLYPAMQTDPMWNNQGAMVSSLVNQIMIPHDDWPGFEGYQATHIMLSVVLPGNDIKPHYDEQGHEWKMRIHVPLVTNPDADYIMDDGNHQMDVGKAYAINVTKEHYVRNRGTTPRIHLLFDVRGL